MAKKTSCKNEGFIGLSNVASEESSSRFYSQTAAASQHLFPVFSYFPPIFHSRDIGKLMNQPRFFTLFYSSFTLTRRTSFQKIWPRKKISPVQVYYCKNLKFEKYCQTIKTGTAKAALYLRLEKRKLLKIFYGRFLRKTHKKVSKPPKGAFRARKTFQTYIARWPFLNLFDLFICSLKLPATFSMIF